MQSDGLLSVFLEEWGEDIQMKFNTAIRTTLDRYGPKMRPVLSALARLSMLAVLELSLARLASAQQSTSWIGGWLSTKPSQQTLQFMLQGKDPALLQRLADEMAALQRNPNDERALSSVGAICLKFSSVKGGANGWGLWQDISARALGARH